MKRWNRRTGDSKHGQVYKTQQRWQRYKMDLEFQRTDRKKRKRRGKGWIKTCQLFLERCNEETASISYEVKDASHKLKIEGFAALIFYGICEILTTMSKKSRPGRCGGTEALCESCL